MLGKAVALPCHTHCLAPRTGVGSRGLVGLYSKAATHDEPRCSPDLQEGTEVVGTVVWAGPKGAKVLLANKVMGFMPMREAPFVIRDSLEEPAPPGRTVGDGQGTFSFICLYLFCHDSCVTRRMPGTSATIIL
jgi:hypothetical protein